MTNEMTVPMAVQFDVESILNGVDAFNILADDRVNFEDISTLRCKQN